MKEDVSKKVTVTENQILMAGAMACAKAQMKNPMVAVMSEEIAGICADIVKLLTNDDLRKVVDEQLAKDEINDMVGKEMEIHYEDTEG